MSEKPAAEPPEGPPWDLPLAEAPLAFVDLEMTGLVTSVDRVIEVCVERVVGAQTIGAFTSLVRPDVWVFGNAHIHGITAEEVLAAPTFAELAPRIEPLLEGAAIVAHAASWDVAFLEAELARIASARRFAFYLDTLTLSRRALALPSHRLGALAEHFGVSRVAAHRAGDDVRVLRAVFTRIVETLKPVTLRDLWHVRIGDKHARPDVLAAAVRAFEGDTTVVVRYRRARRAPEDITMRITSVKTDVEPPQVLGYDTRSRSRLCLRADRILAIEPAPLSC